MRRMRRWWRRQWLQIRILAYERVAIVISPRFFGVEVHVVVNRPRGCGDVGCRSCDPRVFMFEHPYAGSVVDDCF